MHCAAACWASDTSAAAAASLWTAQSVLVYSEMPGCSMLLLHAIYYTLPYKIQCGYSTGAKYFSD